MTKKLEVMKINNINSLSFNEQKNLTVKNIAEKLLKIMEKHVGSENEISRGKLFKKVFKKNEETRGVKALADWVRWEMIKKSMHYCRRYTKCFIASRQFGGVWYYFVVKTRSDAQEYCMVLDKSIKSMRSMQNRALNAAKKQWHREDWFLPGSEQRRLK